MKTRVAWLATLLNFVLCVAFLLGCALTTTNRLNHTYEESLTMTCRLSAEMLDSAAFQADSAQEAARVASCRTAYLDGITGACGISAALYATDGTPLYESAQWRSIAPDQRRWTDLSTETAPDHNASEEGSLYAVARLRADETLVFARPTATWRDTIAPFSGLYIGLLLLSAALQFGLILRLVGRSDHMMESVMHTLSNFADGDFDDQIMISSSLSRTVAARYNAVLARMKERVFHQQRRNMIVSQMLNQMQNGLLAVDEKYTVTFATSMVNELFGRPEGHIEGMSLNKVFANEALESAITEAMHSDGGVLTRDVVAVLSADKERPLRTYVSVMRRDGGVSGALAVIEDITEIRQLEQVRNDFAANVSHEMKTPLTSIKGFIETLQEGAIQNPDMAKKFLNIMMMEADRLTRLINDILSITKLESGQNEVELSRLNLTTMVGSVIELLRRTADAKRVTLSASSDDGDAIIIGNADRVTQMLINLIENGIKYNKEGGSVRVQIFVHDDEINMIVSDTGIGIQKEHLGRLFERFYRVDKGRSRAMGGTGLGLAIVKHIINTMNGMIEVHSKYGEGTEFLVTLPKAPPPSEGGESELDDPER